MSTCKVARHVKKNDQGENCHFEGSAPDVADARTRTVESISKAKVELDRALAELDAVRPLDPTVVGRVAHAMSHYTTVTTATVEMLELTLSDHPDPNVAMWLDGIAHATNLMQHFVGRLVETTPPADFPLKPDYINLELLIQRTCEYYRRRADPQSVGIAIETVGALPLVWADRVAVALIASSLLSNAVDVSPSGSRVRVRMKRESSSVVCEVHDAGPDEQSGEPPLAIAREFIRRLGGELWCTPEPGKGAIWSLRLPALDE
jgi:signal transduction histidine kinase